MAHDALRTILPVAGLPAERARAVEFTGGTDPILPTPFRIGETAAAALAATGLAVSDLWELRTGRSQDVAVDVRRATASLRSGHYLKMEGTEVSTERNPVMGVYPAPFLNRSRASVAAAQQVVSPASTSAPAVAVTVNEEKSGR